MKNIFLERIFHIFAFYNKRLAAHATRAFLLKVDKPSRFIYKSRCFPFCGEPVKFHILCPSFISMFPEHILLGPKYNKHTLTSNKVLHILVPFKKIYRMSFSSPISLIKILNQSTREYNENFTKTLSSNFVDG